jgi:GGDEF domain-containing protein
MLSYTSQVLAAAEQAQSAFRVQLAQVQERVSRRLGQMDFSDAGMSRRYLETRLNEEIKRSQRYRLPLSLLVVRISMTRADWNKWQELTSEVLSASSRLLRTEDIFGHLDGPEFAVILPHTDQDAAEVVIKRLEAGLSAHAPAFGIAQVDRDSSTVAALLEAARADLDTRLAAAAGASSRAARAA